MDLKNAVGIVTGSSSGVGAATVRLLASKGCNVVVNYSSSKDAAQKVAQDCESMDVEVICCQADVASDEDCRRMVGRQWTSGGRLMPW